MRMVKIKKSRIFIFYIIIFAFYCNVSIANSSSLIKINYNMNSDITDQLNQDIIYMSKNGGGDLMIPSGNFYINAKKSINLKSNVNIILNKNTVLNVVPNNLNLYSVFSIKNVENVSISGGKIIGDKYNHLDSKGEWGMGIDIRGSSNILIHDMTISKMWGDGIYISSFKNVHSNKIIINNIHLSDNRRQGITLVSGNNILFERLKIENTSGTKPSAGIDIEPNSMHDQLNNIVLKNITTKNNEGAGIQIGIQRLNNKSNKVDIKVVSHMDIGSRYGMLINDGALKNRGIISIFNSNFINNLDSGFCMRRKKKNYINVNIVRPVFNSKTILSKNYFCKSVSAETIMAIINPRFD